MQLSLFEDISLLREEGFNLRKPFESSNKDKFEMLESTMILEFNEVHILYLQDNNNGTFNTFQFNDLRHNVSINEVMTIARKEINICHTSKTAITNLKK